MKPEQIAREIVAKYSALFSENIDSELTDKIAEALRSARLAGWRAGVKAAANEHENVNPASDEERLKGSPGAGAMGAVIEYRDRIRKLEPK